jgi:hypothetical protein
VLNGSLSGSNQEWIVQPNLLYYSTSDRFIDQAGHSGIGLNLLGVINEFSLQTWQEVTKYTGFHDSQ